jgi:hypothetical protein
MPVNRPADRRADRRANLHSANPLLRHLRNHSPRNHHQLVPAMAHPVPNLANRSRIDPMYDRTTERWTLTDMTIVAQLP